MLTPLIDSVRNEISWNNVSLNMAVFAAEEAETAVVERISEAYPARSVAVSGRFPVAENANAARNLSAIF